MKTVLSLIVSLIKPILVDGETVEHNDDHITFRAADGKSYRIDVTELSE